MSKGTSQPSANPIPARCSTTPRSATPNTAFTWQLDTHRFPRLKHLQYSFSFHRKERKYYYRPSPTFIKTPVTPVKAPPSQTPRNAVRGLQSLSFPLRKRSAGEEPLQPSSRLNHLPEVTSILFLQHGRISKHLKIRRALGKIQPHHYHTSKSHSAPQSHAENIQHIG